MKSTRIEVNLRLAEDQADALAQMAKRICWTDILQLSADEREASAMLDGILRLRDSLAAADVAPR